MKIEIVFDTICPWCYICKRRLERALARRPSLRHEIVWRPFLLNPDMPPEGIDRKLYLERKFGGEHRVQRVFGAVGAAGRAEGLDFDFERIRRTPSTVPSHGLIRFAEHHGLAGEAVEALFSSYFLQGLDIGARDVLLEIGEGLGLPAGPLARSLDAQVEAIAIHHENARAHRVGISGVPSFVFNDSFAIAGAQEPDIFLRMIDLAAEGETAEAPVS